ncbi:MAG: thiamine diphosphokinase [Clostridia bacterium]|nr:thiamine diphosphokinase [Clostridia bacterium]
MRTLVIAGGPNINPCVASIAASCDKVLCADSGADFAVINGIHIDRVIGDMDSISRDATDFLDMKNVPIEVYPPEKDMTDTELVLRSIEKESEVVLACSLTGRIDHVMANLNLILKLHEEGYDITATDGITDVIPMCGKETISLKGVDNPKTAVISLVLNRGDVNGVTTEGLYYKLDRADLKFGSSFSISNKLMPDTDSFSVTVEKGSMLVVITDSEA